MSLAVLSCESVSRLPSLCRVTRCVAQEHGVLLNFSSSQHGTSLVRLLQRVEDVGPTLLIIRDSNDHVQQAARPRA